MKKITVETWKWTFAILLLVSAIFDILLTFGSSVGDIVSHVMSFLLKAILIVAVLFNQKPYTRFLLGACFAYYLVGAFLHWGEAIDSMMSNVGDYQWLFVLNNVFVFLADLLYFVTAVIVALKAGIPTLKMGNTIFLLLFASVVSVFIGMIFGMIYLGVATNSNAIPYFGLIQGLLVSTLLFVGYGYDQSALR